MLPLSPLALSFLTLLLSASPSLASHPSPPCAVGFYAHSNNLGCYPCGPYALTCHSKGKAITCQDPYVVVKGHCKIVDPTPTPTPVAVVVVVAPEETPVASPVAIPAAGGDTGDSGATPAVVDSNPVLVIATPIADSPTPTPEETPAEEETPAATPAPQVGADGVVTVTVPAQTVTTTVAPTPETATATSTVTTSAGTATVTTTGTETSTPDAVTSTSTASESTTVTSTATEAAQTTAFTTTTLDPSTTTSTSYTRTTTAYISRPTDRTAVGLYAGCLEGSTFTGRYTVSYTVPPPRSFFSASTSNQACLHYLSAAQAANPGVTFTVCKVGMDGQIALMDLDLDAVNASLSPPSACNAACANVYDQSGKSFTESVDYKGEMCGGHNWSTNKYYASFFAIASF